MISLRNTHRPSSRNHHLFNFRAKQGSLSICKESQQAFVAHGVTAALAALWRHQGRKQFDKMLSWDKEMLQGTNLITCSFLLPIEQ